MQKNLWMGLVAGLVVFTPFVGVSLVAGAELTTVTWPQFRGVNGAGVSETSRLPAEFGPNKNLKWKVKLPSGLSCPVVWNDRLFVTAIEDGFLSVRCHALNDGRLLWHQDFRPERLEEFHKTEGSPAASSVATDGQHVVAYFGSTGLKCFDINGKPEWTYDLPVADTNNGFGTGVSPIIADGLVILQRDLSKVSFLVALDLATGKEVWKKDRPGIPTSYGTPIVWRAAGADAQLIVPGALLLQSYRLKDGAELWTVRNLPSVACTTPVISGDLLIYAGWAPGDDFKPPGFDELLAQGDENKNGAISAAESEKTFLKNFFENNDLNKNGEIERNEWDSQMEFLARGINRMIAVRPGAMGDATDSHVVWERKKGLPYVPSALAYQGRVHLVKDGGLVSCYDAKTGKPFYEQQRLTEATGGYYASPVAADGKIYLASLEGKVTVLAAGDALKVLATVDLGERASSTPAIAGNTLLIRTANTLWAFGE